MWKMGTNVQVSGAPNLKFYIATNTPGSRDVENGDKCASEWCPSYKRPFSTSRLTRRVVPMWKMGTHVQVGGAPLINLHFPHRD